MLQQAELIGAWELISWQAKTLTGDLIYPWGQDVFGMLIYIKENKMSATLMKANRPNFEHDIFNEIYPKDKAAAFDSFTAYAGNYSIVNNTIIHHVHYCSIPNFVGLDLVRDAILAEDQLTLKTKESNHFSKDRVFSTLKWQRVNSKV